MEEAQTLVPKPTIFVFAAFQFDPEAAKDIDETTKDWPGVTLLKAQMNADLLTDDLKKKRASNESFWLIGQPDVRLSESQARRHEASTRSRCTASTTTTPRPATSNPAASRQIAIWLLDTDYDGRSLYPRQVFFPDGRARATAGRGCAKNLKAEIDEDLIESLPRDGLAALRRRASTSAIAVKIVDDRGIESLKVLGAGMMAGR